MPNPSPTSVAPHGYRAVQVPRSALPSLIPAPPQPAVASIAARATPVVRSLAKRLGVDVAAVAGSGAGGRVTRGDVTAAASSSRAVPAAGALAPARPTSLYELAWGAEPVDEAPTDPVAAAGWER